MGNVLSDGTVLEARIQRFVVILDIAVIVFVIVIAYPMKINHNSNNSYLLPSHSPLIDMEHGEEV